MKRNVRVLVVIAALAVCIVFALGAFSQSPRAHQKWEYRDGANVQLDQMNAYGEEGWELVTVVPYGRDYYYVFRRPK
ncbi:MAG TPA: hypothetical protein VL126_13250 [Bacteroidota bacterium]|nr:hypothetical protein [Bacteroidota bacterium]